MSKYEVYKIVVKGLTHYYVSFSDVNQKIHKVEVNRVVYLSFVRFQRSDWSQQRKDKRHLTDQDVQEISVNPSPLWSPYLYLENIDLHERIQNALLQLPEKQRRRLLLYYAYQFTLKEISHIEGCTERAVKFSIDYAKKKLVNIL